MKSEEAYKRIFNTWYDILKPIVYSNKFEKFLLFLMDKYNKRNSMVLPGVKDVFKPFSDSNFNDIHTVILFDRRMFNRNSNGLAFGQKDSSLSIDYEIESFYETIERSTAKSFTLDIDITLESMQRQGFLLINTCYTTEMFNMKKHRKHWYKFNVELFKLLSIHKTKLNYILIGSDAWKYAKYITGSSNYIFKAESFKIAEQEHRDWKFDFHILDTLIRVNHNKNITW